MAEALLEIVIENLGSFVQNQLSTYWGVDQQTLKLSSNLTAIRAVLRDAERKQLTSHALKDWLQKLTDAAYVLDDILDECSIQSKKEHSDDGQSSCFARVHPKDILFRFHIGKRMKDITQRFHDIHEERLTFELRVGVTEKQAVDDEDDDWRQTSSVITEPIFCGRHKDRKKIVKFLLKDASKSEDLSIYPIVGNVEVEDVGNKVWKKLYRRSFFQEAKSDKLGMIRSCKMHDLFHDLAQSIMGEECVVIEKGRLTQLPTRVHYVNLSNYEVSIDMTALKKVESLRTFLDLGDNGLVPSNHCLRVLHTRSPLFPLQDLGHLRYLSVRGGSGASLNNIICQLPKLQILKLEYLSQLRLPRDLTQLQDLRHIVIDNCYPVKKTPPNISKLRNLRTLTTFVVGSKAGCGLAELHSLKLGGTLRIKGLENVPNEWDAKQANLIGKKDLNILHLSWGGNANSEGSNVNVERVLEALQPPSTLKSFEMKGYQGRQLSSWMRNGAVLRDLVEVTLLDCDNCEDLPPLGKLPQLKRLEVGGMKNVKWIDGDSYDGVEEKAFPSLEKLSVENLPRLERMLREEGVEMLPRLSRLTIIGVSNLKFPRLPSVENLEAKDIDEGASFMEGVVENMPCLKILEIERVKGLVVLPDQFSGLGSLQELIIQDCYDLEYFPEYVLEGLTSLRNLRISLCRNLKSLSEGVQHLTCLESLRISYCSKLVTLPSNMNQLTALRSVEINGCSTLLNGLPRVSSKLIIESCNDLEYFPEHVLEGQTSLRNLRIALCENLKSLSEGVQHLTCLESLRISYCPKLVTLPSNMNQLTALRSVEIVGCSTLPNGLERVPFLRTLHISYCTSTSLPDWLGDMTSLQKLEFYKCEKLRNKTVFQMNRLFVNFAEVFAVADLDCMHDAMNKLNSDSKKINPQD
ncbi:hypothetical protein VNO80_09068 [Phaseolus coccineus]|uniref:Rx N-terminal domain-containing protein n=1 Tax=Phaseolus coccineus TaxID=3886 RepID=A0AAN9N7B2_PHACN